MHRATIKRSMLAAFAAATLVSGGTRVAAQQPSLSTYGTPGLIEIPTAERLPDGTLAFTSSLVGPTLRNTLTFQILPRVSGSFRYARISGQRADGSANYDRSFDVHFHLLDETEYRPALGVGLRDFLGTGLYSGEYVVATKGFGSRLQVTGGIGWGRFAGRDSFTNPLSVFGDGFKTRSNVTASTGGQLETGNWFRGPAAIFGGVKWQYNDRTTLFAEYSTDVYPSEVDQGLMDRPSPLNVGLQYRFKNGVDLKAFVLGGEEVGAQFSYVFDPAKRRSPGGREAAPWPVGNRNTLAAASWNLPDASGSTARDVLDARLNNEGIDLQGYETTGTRAVIRVENTRWDVEAQAAGRAARVMAATLAPQVEEFVVVFQDKGVPISQIITQRSDLEQYQHAVDGSWRTYERADIQDAFVLGGASPLPGTYPVFDYSLTPYAAFSYFDPDNPVRGDVGAQLKLAFRPTPGLTFAGRFRYPLAGNLDNSDRVSDSVLPHVRSDAVLYAKESEFEVNTLTAEYLFRPGKDLFARVTAGYLEDMYGGVSAELLWYPVASRLALGAEINYARQRDFDMLFGFQDYGIVTGHASAYYDFGNGFLGQIDAGRYLAGDWGATVSLDREFNNGFRVGGYFTLTDVSADDFGEGSFDKGIRFEVPLSWLTGKPSRTVLSQTIRPVNRDGGARLNVDNRLHRIVRDYRGKELSDGWGRYLR